MKSARLEKKRDSRIQPPPEWIASAIRAIISLRCVLVTASIRSIGGRLMFRFDPACVSCGSPKAHAGRAPSPRSYDTFVRDQMHVLVLGGTILTGPYAVRRLRALGHEVTVFHRGEHESDFPESVRHIHGDFAHPPPEAFDPAPDVVVHMWAMTETDAERFVKTFRGLAGRAVVISSGDVYRAYGRLTGLEPGPPGPIPSPRMPLCANPATRTGKWRPSPATG